MAHWQNAEKESPVEHKGIPFDCSLHLRDSALDLLRNFPVTILRKVSTQIFELFQLLPTAVVFVIATDDLRESVTARKSGGKDDSGIVPQRFWQNPAFWQARSLARCLVAHCQRNAGIPQGVDSGCERERCSAVKGGDSFCGNSKLLLKIESSGSSREFDRVAHIFDGLEGRITVCALHQASDVSLNHSSPKAIWNGVYELLAMEETCNVRVIEHVIRPRQTQGGSGNDDRI